VVVIGTTEGRRGIADLFRHITIWRVGVVWYVLAIGVPLLVAVVAQVAHAMVAGGPIGMSLSTPLPLTVILALLVIGEEIGWRGFALPRLQHRYTGLAASLILGGVWACWHLANATLPGLEAYWSSFPAFLFFVLGQTIFFTWMWNRTAGSLLVMWILHAMVNTSISLFFVGDQAQEWWFAGGVLAMVAIVVLVVDGVQLARRPSPSLVQRSTAA
jgi:membrane protease YdiL (CAAX protease family)